MKRVSPTPIMNRRVLLVDDEEGVVRSLKLALRKQPYETFSALSGNEGLGILRKEGPETFDVIMSDMKMPNMDGAQFFAEAKELCPDSSRILLTGHAEINSCIAAVNEGSIFRFLTKPCSQDELYASIDAGIRQRELIQAERVLLEKTLNGAIDALMQVMAVSKPLLFGRSRRVYTLAKDFGLALGIPNQWELEIAAQFSQLGLLILPDEVVKAHYYGKELSRVEKNMVARGPSIVERVLKKVPRLEGVREIIKRMASGDTSETERENDPIDLLASILRSATEIESLKTQGKTFSEAVETVVLSGNAPEPLLAVLRGSFSEESQGEVQKVNSEEIGDYLGWRLADDVYLPPDFLLATRGALISVEFVQLVQSYLACRDDFPEVVEISSPRASL
jgi:FixJ family two-component response regulator